MSASPREFLKVDMSRFSNQMGGEQEIYHSNGGLTAKYAADMNMQPNLLAERSLMDRAEKTETAVGRGDARVTHEQAKR